MKSIRKEILFVAGVLVMGVAIYSHSLLEKRCLSDLALENIEALAEHEWVSPICVGSGSVCCPINNSKVSLVVEYASLE